MAFPTGWGFKTDGFAIKASKIGSGMSGDTFVVVVTEAVIESWLTADQDDWWDNVKSDGGDIRASSDAAGTTRLALEVVAIDTAAETMELHIERASVSSSTDTDIYLWWDEATESQPAVGAAFGRNATWADSFEAVYHLQEDPSDSAPQFIDSTGNGINLTTLTTMVAGDSVAGQIGQGVIFDNGSSEGAANTSTAAITVSPFTMETWINPTSLTNFDKFLGVGRASGANHRMWLEGNSGGAPSFFTRAGTGGTEVELVAASSFSAGTFSYVAAVLISDASAAIYVDGDSGATDTTSRTIPTSLDETGVAALQNTAFTPATMDESRFHSVARDADWILASFRNADDPADFFTVATAEAIGGGTTFFQTNTGSLTPAGALERRVNKELAGSLTATGALVKQIEKTLAGSMTPAGAVTKLIQKLLAGVVTASGALATQTVVMQAVAGSTTPTGTVQKQVNKILVGAITPSGALQKRIAKVLDGSLTPAGTVATTVVILLTVTGQLIVAGALATLFIAGGAAGRVARKFVSLVLRPIIRSILRDDC